MLLRHTIVLLLISCLNTHLRAESPTVAREAKTDFFEEHIRPVLIEHCHACHSSEAAVNNKLKAGLRLDHQQTAMRGGESGIAIVPGSPEGSTLLQALQYDGLEMPPQGKLPQTTIDKFQQWIQMGAPWPAAEAVVAQRESPLDTSFEEWRKQHWAWRPITRPALPQVANRNWSTMPIDLFVIANLETNGLQPAKIADRRTLVRRLYFDLLGLPPTYEQVESFVNDESEDAYQQLVDRLLASPHYGERWGRHWLDVARYADNGGWHSQNPELTNNFHFAYTYRDYVVRAFNEDLPYDQFLLEQLAADKLPVGEDNRALAATGLLTIGDKSLGITKSERIDDVVDTITRGMMGITVSCARCHDHKYDPIPTKDYYSLFGVFQNSQIDIASNMHPIEKTDKFPTLFATKAERTEHEAALASQTAVLNALERVAMDSVWEYCRTHAGEYLLAVATADTPKGLNGKLLARWREYLKEHATESDAVWGPWNRFVAASRDDGLSFEIVCEQFGEFDGLDPLVRNHLQQRPLHLLQDVAGCYQRLIVEVFDENSSLQQSQREHLRKAFAGDKSPMTPDLASALELGIHQHQEQLDRQRARTHRLAYSQPRALAIKDNDQIGKTHVYVRGNPSKQGDEVSRQFLAILAKTDERKPFADGSGRLELAKAITARDNPLTARVIVNRVWRHHVGSGLVDSTSDFGTRSDPPSHPELLDYLASGLMDNGWSLKWLHRQIVLSTTYRQSSADRSDLADIDPENRWLARMNRRRLELEPMRDSMLWAAGQLQQQLGGQASPPWESKRRTIYGFINRYRMPEAYATFDYPNASTSVPRRSRTLVPQQALFLMNSDFAQSQADELANSLAANDSHAIKIASVYRRVLSRNPSQEELRTVQQFVGQADEPWKRLAQALFMSNEFSYVD